MTITDYYNHDWDVQLPNHAAELDGLGYHGLSAREFYDLLLQDEDIAPHLEPKDYVTGLYSPRLLIVAPKGINKLSAEEKLKYEKWKFANDHYFRTVAELQRQERGLMKTMQAGTGGYWVWDRDGKLSYEHYNDPSYKQFVIDDYNYQIRRLRSVIENYIFEGGPQPSFNSHYTRFITQGKEELFKEINKCNNDNFLIVRPVSYAGGTMEDKNARLLHALVIEVDDLRPQKLYGKESGLITKQVDGVSVGLLEIINRFKTGKIPTPTAIVCSGNGIHLYYIFKRAIPMYPNIRESLAGYRHWLTEKLWNSYTSTNMVVQHEAVTQGFRVVGSYAKDGRRVAMAFKVGDRVDVEYLNSFVPAATIKAAKKKNVEVLITDVYKSKMTLAEARKKYPEWYQARVVDGRPIRYWKMKRYMYDNWLEKAATQAQIGYRYKCMENAASLALKCGISREELDHDLHVLRDRMEEHTMDPKNRLTDDDIASAMFTYDHPTPNAYCRKVEYLRNRFPCIDIPVNKRNHRTRASNLKLAREAQNEDDPEGTWRGRPSKADQVREWRAAHPDGTKYRCQQDTGMSKATIYKWWDSADSSGGGDTDA